MWFAIQSATVQSVLSAIVCSTASMRYRKDYILQIVLAWNPLWDFNGGADDAQPRALSQRDIRELCTDFQAFRIQRRVKLLVTGRNVQYDDISTVMTQLVLSPAEIMLDLLASSMEDMRVEQQEVAKVFKDRVEIKAGEVRMTLCLPSHDQGLPLCVADSLHLNACI
jgi:hypothetical protein